MNLPVINYDDPDKFLVSFGIIVTILSVLGIIGTYNFLLKEFKDFTSIPSPTELRNKGWTDDYITAYYPAKATVFESMSKSLVRIIQLLILTIILGFIFIILGFYNWKKRETEIEKRRNIFAVA